MRLGTKRITVFAVPALLIASLSSAVNAGQAAAATVVSTADTTGRGWYSNESALSPSVVGSSNFAKRWTATVNGQVYAPLVRSGTTVIAATENNDVEAFTLSTGARLWKHGLGQAWPSSTISCSDLTPNVGVTGRPVLSSDGTTVYMVAKTYSGTDVAHPTFYLHALNVATGAERTGWPVQIKGSADNDSSVAFNALGLVQRPGLLLLNGVVYAAFGSLCDNNTARGWVAGVSTSTAKQTALWTTEAHATAATPLGSIWQSGGELVSDRAGSIVFSTGNGQVPPVGSTAPSTVANSVVRLAVQSTGKLSLADYFSPWNADALNTTDQDLGSGAPTSLPSLFGTTSVPSAILQGGSKAGYMYLLNAAAFGHRGSTSDNVLQRLGQYGRIFSQPAVYPGEGGWVYVVTSGPVLAFKNSPSNGKPHLSKKGQTGSAFGFTSSSPVVTSNGTTAGSALVWAIQSPTKDGANSKLVALHAIPSSTGILTSVFSSPTFTAAKFGRPLIADNRVLIGTRSGTVIAFGTP